MAVVYGTFQDISLISINGETVDTSNDDAVIVYSSNTGTNWTYVTDSDINSSVVWEHEPLEYLGGSSTRTFNYDNFPDNEYIKLEIVPGGCDGNCSGINGYDFYGDDTAQLYPWPDHDRMGGSSTGNELGSFYPSVFIETLDEEAPGVLSTTELTITLTSAETLISIPYNLPDMSLSSIFSNDESAIASIVGEGIPAIPISPGNWIGSLQEIDPTKSYLVELNPNVSLPYTLNIDVEDIDNNFINYDYPYAYEEVGIHFSSFPIHRNDDPVPLSTINSLLCDHIIKIIATGTCSTQVSTLESYILGDVDGDGVVTGNCCDVPEPDECDPAGNYSCWTAFGWENCNPNCNDFEGQWCCDGNTDNRCGTCSVAGDNSDTCGTNSTQTCSEDPEPGCMSNPPNSLCEGAPSGDAGLVGLMTVGMAGPPTENTLEWFRTDVNGSGNINSGDATAISRYLNPAVTDTDMWKCNSGHCDGYYVGDEICYEPGEPGTSIPGGDGFMTAECVDGNWVGSLTELESTAGYKIIWSSFPSTYPDETLVDSSQFNWNKYFEYNIQLSWDSITSENSDMVTADLDEFGQDSIFVYTNGIRATEDIPVSVDLYELINFESVAPIPADNFTFTCEVSGGGTIPIDCTVDGHIITLLNIIPNSPTSTYQITVNATADGYDMGDGYTFDNYFMQDDADIPTMTVDTEPITLLNDEYVYNIPLNIEDIDNLLPVADGWQGINAYVTCTSSYDNVISNNTNTLVPSACAYSAAGNTPALTIHGSELSDGNFGVTEITAKLSIGLCADADGNLPTTPSTAAICNENNSSNCPDTCLPWIDVFAPPFTVTIPEIEGCVEDENACNYEASANSNTECLENDCAGVCGGDATTDCCNGCQSPDVCLQDDDCGVCDGDNSSCTGCMDDTACNYDSGATINGECDYGTECLDGGSFVCPGEECPVRPVLTEIDDKEMSQNETLDITLTVTDSDSDTHTFTASSSVPGLVTTSISGTTLILTTVTGQYGESDITVYATDDDGMDSVEVDFTLTVYAINTQVSDFELIYTGDDIQIDEPNKTITLSEDTPIEGIKITPTPTALFDIETSFSDLSFSVFSSNESLLTAEIDTSGIEALLSLTPKEQQYGTSSIEIWVTDTPVGNADTTRTIQTYTVIILSVFDRPLYHNVGSDDNYQIFGPMNQSETLTSNSSTLDMGCMGHDPITQFKFKYEGEGTLSLEGTEYNSCVLDEDGYCEVDASTPDTWDDLDTNYLHSTGFNITYTPPPFFAGKDSFMWSCTSGHAATNTLGDWAYVDEPDNYITTQIEVDYLETDVAFGYDDGLGITIEQSLSNSHDPMSGISVITDNLQNTKQSIEVLDFDKRPSLGMFYYDDDNPLRNEFTPNLPSPFTQITKPNLIENGNGRMVLYNSGGEGHPSNWSSDTYTPRGWGYINMSGVKDNTTYNTINYMPYFIQDSAPNDEALLFAGYLSYTVPSTDNLDSSDYNWAKWKKSTECYSYGKCLHFDN